MLLRRSWKRSTKVTDATVVTFRLILSSSSLLNLKPPFWPHVHLRFALLCSCFVFVLMLASGRFLLRSVLSSNGVTVSGSVLLYPNVRKGPWSSPCPSGLLTPIHSSACHTAAAVDAPFRAAPEGPAVERDCQHRPHWRSEPDPNGSQRPERSVCQVQTGKPEIQEQGEFSWCFIWCLESADPSYGCVFAQAVPKTLSPQWREQFDLHLYEESGGVLEITVWDKDTGRRDDFIGRSVTRSDQQNPWGSSCSGIPKTGISAQSRCACVYFAVMWDSLRLHSCMLDLSTLAKEHTHHLELPLEEARGFVVLLVTLTASAHVSIADLSVTPLDDPQERREILNRYVRMEKNSPTHWFLIPCVNGTLASAGFSEVLLQPKGRRHCSGEGAESRRTHGCRCHR